MIIWGFILCVMGWHVWRSVVSIPHPRLLSVIDAIDVNVILTIILFVGFIISVQWQFLVHHHLNLW